MSAIHPIKGEPLQILKYLIDITPPNEAYTIATIGIMAQHFPVTLSEKLGIASIEDFRKAAEYANECAYMALCELERLQRRLTEVPESFGSHVNLGRRIGEGRQKVPPSDFRETVEKADRRECLASLAERVKERGEAEADIQRLKPELRARLAHPQAVNYYDGLSEEE